MNESPKTQSIFIHKSVLDQGGPSLLQELLKLTKTANTIGLNGVAIDEISIRESSHSADIYHIHLKAKV